MSKAWEGWENTKQIKGSLYETSKKNLESKLDIPPHLRSTSTLINILSKASCKKEEENDTNP
jgi:hypothetical protein